MVRRLSHAMNILRRLFGKKSLDNTDHPPARENAVPVSPKGARADYQFRWYDPGPENPFGIRLLDCRPLTQTVIATTSDRSIAERYNLLRGSNGRDLISAQIPDSVRCPASLRFPHNGAPLKGIVFKAPSMDVKWDIYVYDSVFHFARSWTGELQYRAFATVGPSDIHVTEIECPRLESKIAACHVYFLVATHAMGRVLPHRLPEGTPEDPMTIATLSFSMFGNLGCYATFEDITRIPITRPSAS